MIRLLFALGLATVAALVSPRSADAGFYPRPYYGFYYRPDDYGRRVVGYTFPGRR